MRNKAILIAALMLMLSGLIFLLVAPRTPRSVGADTEKSAQSEAGSIRGAPLGSTATTRLNESQHHLAAPTENSHSGENHPPSPRSEEASPPAAPDWEYFPHNEVVKTSLFKSMYEQESVADYSDAVAVAILQRARDLDAKGDFSLYCVSCRSELCLLRIRAVSNSARSAALSGERSVALQALTLLTRKQADFKIYPHPAYTVLSEHNSAEDDKNMSGEVLLEHYVKLIAISSALRSATVNSKSVSKLNCQ